MTIFSTISGSASMVWSPSSISTRSARPERSVAARKTAADSRTTRARSTGLKCAVARPASTREKSSSALTRRSIRSAPRWAIAIRSCWAAGAGSSSASASGPSISISGVRNSCETLAKNSVLDRSSSISASARACSASCTSALESAAAT